MNLNQANPTTCFSCGNPELKTRFDAVPGVWSGEYRIVQCQTCGVAFVQAESREVVDYSDYGEHITREEPSYYRARLGRTSLPKRLLFRYIKRKFSAEASILDFGCGAGFFVKSCQQAGFPDACGVEPSKRFRSIAVTRLGLEPASVSDDIASFSRKFDVIAMLDVIEHLPVTRANEIMEQLVSHLRPGGLLLGTTPNLNSLNIKLFKARDPVIAPPQHSIYFAERSLDVYLTKFGLAKKLLLNVGLNTNSFFRTQKFAPSWVERPSPWQTPASLLIRLLFAPVGAGLGFLGYGYSMYFVYEKSV